VSDTKDIRRAISIWAADQMNACETADEQRVFIEEFIKVGIGLWTLRLHLAADQDQKRKGIDEISHFVAKVIAASAAKLMALNTKR